MDATALLLDVMNLNPMGVDVVRTTDGHLPATACL